MEGLSRPQHFDAVSHDITVTQTHFDLGLTPHRSVWEFEEGLGKVDRLLGGRDFLLLLGVVLSLKQPLGHLLLLVM